MSTLRDLKGFRHIVRHAYDLQLRPGRLEELAADATRIRAAFTSWVVDFGASVRSEQGWPLP